MKQYEYDLQHFAVTEKYNPKKQAEALATLTADLNAKGAEGWELLGLNAFELTGGFSGQSKGQINLTVWKREKV